MTKNITPSDKTLNTFSLGLKIRQGFPLSPHLINRVLEVLIGTLKQVKERKGIRITKEEIEVGLFANDMIFLLKRKKSVSLKIRNKTGMSSITTLIPVALDTLATVIRHEEEVQSVQIGKEEVKLSLFAYREP